MNRKNNIKNIIFIVCIFLINIFLFKLFIPNKNMIIKKISKINNNAINKIDTEIVNIPDKNLKDALISLLRGQKEWNIRYINEEKGYIKPEEENEIYKGELEIIEKLNISKESITDLTGLENLKNIKELNLMRNNIIDTTPLKNSTQLTQIKLSNNKIENIEVFKNMPNLEKIEINDNKIKTLKGLEHIKKLSTLDVRDNLLENAEPIKNMESIRNFLGDRNNFTNLDDFKNIVVGSFSVRKCFIKDISGLNVKELLSLQIERNQINNIDVLKDATNLQMLEMQNNRNAWHIPETNNMPSMDLSPLKNCKNLVYLDSSGNKVEDASVLSENTALVTLRLVNNNIEDISFLKNYRKIKGIDFTANNIKDISVIKDLSTLKNVNISGNLIENIDAAQNLNNLREFIAAGNNIKDFRPLKDKTELTGRDKIYQNQRDVDRQAQRIYYTAESKVIPVDAIELYDINGEKRTLTTFYAGMTDYVQQREYLRKNPDGSYQIIKKPKNGKYFEFIQYPNWNNGGYIRIDVSKLTFYEPKIKSEELNVLQYSDPNKIPYNTSILNLPEGAKVIPSFTLNTAKVGKKLVEVKIELTSGEYTYVQIPVNVIPLNIKLNLEFKNKLNNKHIFENLDPYLLEKNTTNYKELENILDNGNITNKYKLEINEMVNSDLVYNGQKDKKTPKGFIKNNVDFKYEGDFYKELYLVVNSNDKEMSRYKIAENGKILLNEINQVIELKPINEFPNTGVKMLKNIYFYGSVLTLSGIYLINLKLEKTKKKRRKNRILK